MGKSGSKMMFCGGMWWGIQENDTRREGSAGRENPREEGDRVFTGEYNHTIDAKGRLIIPARLREQLGDSFTVTKGMYGQCLAIYPADEWEIFANKLRTLPLNNPNTMKVIRFFSSGATACELDKQGRILLPASLREFADLKKDVVLAGVMNCVEIWDKEAWTANNQAEDISEELMGLYQNGISI